MTERRLGRDEDPARGARALFERAAQALPPATAARLRQQRMATLHGGAPSRPLAWALPVGAMAALLVGLAWWRAVPVSAPAEGAGAEFAVGTDVVALPAAAPDEAELYAWLAEAPVASDAGADGTL